MSSLLICIGKKNHIKAVVDYVQGLAKKNEIQIVAQQQKTIKKLLRSAEELKMVIDSDDGKKVNFEKELLRPLEYAGFKRDPVIIVRLIAPDADDKWLSLRIRELTHAFQVRGGRLELGEVVEQQVGIRKTKVLPFVLAGAPKAVVAYKDLLVREKIIDPNSIEFIL